MNVLFHNINAYLLSEAFTVTFKRFISFKLLNLINKMFFYITQ